VTNRPHEHLSLIKITGMQCASSRPRGEIPTDQSLFETSWKPLGNRCNHPVQFSDDEGVANYRFIDSRFSVGPLKIGFASGFGLRTPQ
jgi:hypothetical protein